MYGWVNPTYMQEISMFILDLLKFLGGGVGVWGVTELVKRAPFLPVSEGQKTRIRTLSAALSAVAVVLLGVVDKTLKIDDVSGAIVAVFGAFVAWGASHWTHRAVGQVRSLIKK